MEFHGSFHIGRKENLRYNYFTARGKIWLGVVLVFLVILVLTGSVRLGESGDVRSALLATLPYALGGAALLLLVNLAVIYLRVRAQYKGGRAAFEQELTLDEAGVHAVTKTGRSDIGWKDLCGVTESPKDFYLFITPASAYVLPKDQLERPEDAATVRAMLRARAGGKLRLHG